MTHRIAKAIAFAAMCTATTSGAWVDGWLQNYTQTGPGYFQGQQRGYFTGGSLSARWRLNNANPISIAPPRISAGCGGIDAFWGGFSFLDSDYFVNMGERMIQAAPAIAFDLALKTLDKETSDSISKAMEYIQKLNSIQMDECAMTQNVVTAVSEGDSSIVSDYWMQQLSVQNAEQTTTRNQQETTEELRANDGVPPESLTEAIADCPADFRDIYGGGSILENTADRAGMGQYVDVFRGLVGDVVVTIERIDGNNQFIPVDISHCAQNDATDPSQIITENIYGKNLPAANPAAGACSPDNSQTLREFVTVNMLTISQKLSQGSQAPPLTQQERDFLNVTPLPVYQILLTATVKGTTNETINLLADPLAAAYANRIFSDLYASIVYGMSIARTASNVHAQQGGDEWRCNPKVLSRAIEKSRDLLVRAEMYRDASRTSYLAKLQEIQVMWNLASGHRDDQRQVMGDHLRPAAGR